MFIKCASKITRQQFECIQSNLIAKQWHLQDVISPHTGKQVYVTLESLLGSTLKFMDSTSDARPWNGFQLGDDLAYGYTLAYCNPISNLRELGTDGFDNYHAPVFDGQEPFLRRMWLSGNFQFKRNRLKYGDLIEFEESVGLVKHLTRLNTILCDYNRSFSNSKGVSVVETRRLCYISDKYKEKHSGEVYNIPIDNFIFVTPNMVSSFRISALCFNAHLIHYDSNYVQKEGYPQVVVEGPLLILLSLQYWMKLNQNQKVKSFDYKITSPVFLNDKIRVCHSQIAEGEWKLWIDHGDDSPVCLGGTLKTY